jgi:hypothetical protein
MGFGSKGFVSVVIVLIKKAASSFDRVAALNLPDIEPVYLNLPNFK